MLLRGFIPISVILLGILFAAVKASSSFHIEKTTSCGRVELQQCWCLDENPCDSPKKSKKIDSTDVIPIIMKKNILTAKYIKKHINSKSPTKLNLTGKNFEAIDKNAFNNFTHLKSLDLSANSLSKLPAFIFSKLSNLEYLDLSGNGMKTTRKIFAGLSNLKTLNITKNALNRVLGDNFFFGLTKSCEIHVTPKSVKKLSADAFGNEPPASLQDPTKKSSNKSVKKLAADAFGNEPPASLQDPTKKSSNKKAPKAKSIHPRSALWTSYNRFSTFQICIKNNTVQQLDVREGFGKMENGCEEISIRYGHLEIQNLGITDFEKGWFHLQDEHQVSFGFSVLEITENNMSRISEYVVNDLPEYITWLDMKNNKIERLDSGTFVHNRIFSLELRDNLISEIADNTFKMPKLYQLYLQNNRLKDTKFMATMPENLNSIDLENNEITEISPNSFSTLKKLGWLNLERNRIITIGNNCFHGAKQLATILLSMNNISTIEPGVFDYLDLGALSLDKNGISSIEKGVFNKLFDVQHLSLSGNKFEKIPSGLFDLPTMERLDLSKNQITEIEKSAMKSLGHLDELELSSNPITRLENGAFFGLNKTRKCKIILDHSPVEIIHGGVFDDV